MSFLPVTSKCTSIVIPLLALVPILAVSFVWGFNQYLSFDEGYNLYLSRTLAAEGFYGTKTHAELRPFDPAVTTGPPMLLLLGLAFKLFGTKLLVAKIFLFFLFSACLVALWFTFYFILHKNFLGACLATYCIATVPHFLDLGMRALGEVLAVTLIVVGLGILDLSYHASTPNLWKRVFLPGFFFFLAITVKDIVVFSCLGLAIVIVAEVFTRSSQTTKYYFHFLTVAAIGLTTPFFLRWVYKLMVQVSFPHLHPVYVVEASSRSTLLTKLVIFSPFANTRDAIGILFGDFVVQTISFIFVVAFFLVFSVVSLRRGQPFPSLVFRLNVRVLLVTGLLWMLWFVVFSGEQANARHMFPGVVFMTAATVQVLFLIAKEINDSQMKIIAIPAPGWRLLTVVFFVVAVVSVLNWYFTRWSSQKNARGSQQATAEFIRKTVPDGEGISGWGWYVPWHVAFLAARTPSKVRLNTSELHGLTDWLVLVPEMGSQSRKDPRLQALLEEQSEMLFASGGYQVFRILQAQTGKMVQPQITALYPNRTKIGVGFNVQPTGASAIALVGNHFTIRAKVIMGGYPLETTYGSKTIVTAIVPSRLLSQAGQLDVWVVTEAGESNHAVFTVEP